MKDHLLAMLVNERASVIEAQEGDVEQEGNVLRPIDSLHPLEHQIRQQYRRQVASLRGRGEGSGQVMVKQRCGGEKE